MSKKTARQKAIIRRNIFLSVCGLTLALIIALSVFVISSIVSNLGDNDEKSDSVISSQTSKTEETVEKKNTTDPLVDGKLNPDFENLMLINGKNPLPENYEDTLKLVTIDEIYRNNNNVTDIEETVYPFITAMVKKANEDGVNLKVWSPFRSYAIQRILFEKQVERVGGDEDKAATVVARPGTSEHNTGLCADFNMADDKFEATEMYTWMTENAEDYGFVLRYPKDKTEITGVIYESWHWRFVGINRAKEMNKLGLCLEEYIEYLEDKN